MATNFVIDQAATFQHVVLLQSDPKLAFGSEAQDATKDGLPLWTVQLVAAQEQFGKTVNEVLKVTVASPKNPSDGVPPFAPVRLHGFSVGVMASTRKDKTTGAETITGAQVYYRCDRIEAAITPMKHADK